jgi:hypothetical protein
MSRCSYQSVHRTAGSPGLRFSTRSKANSICLPPSASRQKPYQ